MDEVLRIKQVLLKGDFETDSVLVDSLKRLQKIDVSCQILKDTLIGKSVAILIKHGKTMQIRLLAKALVSRWKRMVKVAIADGTFRRCQRSTNGEKKQAKKESEKPKKAIIHNKNRVIGEDMKNATKKIRFQQNPNKALVQKKPLVKEDTRKSLDEIAYQQTLNKALVQKKPVVQVKEKRSLNETESQRKRNNSLLQEDTRKGFSYIESQQKSNKIILILKKPVLQEDKPKYIDEAARLEAARKRLRENYQEAENAKRQRRIQVVEERDLQKEVMSQTKAYVEKKGFYRCNRA